jgi:hypothetical protein
MDEEEAILREHEDIERLAEERWILKRRLGFLESEIRKRSFYFSVGNDGLVDLGTGIFH